MDYKLIIKADDALCKLHDTKNIKYADEVIKLMNEIKKQSNQKK